MSLRTNAGHMRFIPLSAGRFESPIILPSPNPARLNLLPGSGENLQSIANEASNLGDRQDALGRWSPGLGLRGGKRYRKASELLAQTTHCRGVTSVGAVMPYPLNSSAMFGSVPFAFTMSLSPPARSPVLSFAIPRPKSDDARWGLYLSAEL
jgi:hypothetical protein